MRLAKSWIFFSVILLLFIYIIALKQSHSSTPPIKDNKGNVIPESIASLEMVELGDINQCILIRGNNLSNPILLWLHGGPGSAQMPVAHYFNGALEKDFIVVHWDQRGAGKSNPGNFDNQTMTFEQFLNDAHQLTQYLKKHFNKEKIYLIGHSWGTQLGSKLVYTYPDDYYAYVAVSQVVNPLLSHNVSYTWLYKQIEEKGKPKDFKYLEELGTPPFTVHQDYVNFAKMVDTYGGGMDVSMVKLAWIALRAPEYRLSDYIAWFQGANRGSGPMWKSSLSFNLIQEVPRLLVPVYFFSGRNDYNTPLQLVEEYFEMLDAPKGKQLVRFEKSAHTPFMGEAEKFNRELIRVKNETYQ